MQDNLVLDIGAKVAVNAFSEIFKSGFHGLKTLGKWAIDLNKEHDYFGIAAQRYTERLEERFDSIRIFGMNTPIKLRSIYINVNILEKLTSRQRTTIADLEEHFDRDRRGFGITQETREGLDIVNRLSKFILLGKPGSGKTTFLKYVVLQASEDALHNKRLPIFISLKDLSETSQTLMDFIIEQFDICHFPDAGPFIERILENGECVVLFDGLDEVDKTQEPAIVTQIRNFSDKYSSNQFILSSRIAAYNYCFEQFVDVEIADFVDDQIEHFIHNWFGSDERKGQLCWARLKDDKPLRELASIPLLLTLFCLAFDESMNFPTNRSELYGEAINALLRKWDASKSVKREEMYKNLSVRRKESLFSRTASITFEKGQYFLPQRSLERHIADFVKHLPDASEKTLELDSEAVLKAIEAQHGIFVERAKGIYSFSHLTFQEYFTAKYIMDHPSDDMKRIVNQYLTDERWRDVFLMTTGMLEDAENFLALIKDRIDSLIKDGRPAIILKVIKNIIAKQVGLCVQVTAKGVSLAAVTAIDLAFILAHKCASARDKRPKIDLQHHLAFALARDLALEIALILGRIGNFDEFLKRVYERALERSYSQIKTDTSRRTGILEGPDIYSDNTSTKELALDLIQVLYYTNPIDLDFGQEFLEELIVYLKANQLLLDCLATECYMTKDMRQLILDEMLAV